MEDYNYQAKLALTKNDYKTARVALNKIIELYPETAYATAAQKALDGIVPVAVAYYKKKGDANYHPEGHDGVPQTKAREFYESMYNEDPDGPKADYALYYWARALGTEGKMQLEIKLLQQHLEKFPKSKMRGQALYLLGFTYACNNIRQ